ncbi:Shedu anti-phage system protein SduA domain-containing protein [Vibrio sp. 10N.222.49.A3]|uniref:Shedu anti-phage system protein SduA domain-containing protein n=1 Tax=Vibrio TaxID=662 RepID=UPI001B312F08|nr:Shedu anti-phage system protein SduA domain-containing protein [Vibrio crassostreae]CAK2122986.1 putative DUF4263 domain-containing protein [Vibrio crassostreae]CAK2872177.1 putative DUF4263 domain-containing protein [Vibrio crassostreae]
MIQLLQNELYEDESRKQLDDLKVFLDAKDEYGEKEIHDFFKARPQLILLMGKVLQVKNPSRYNDELPVIGKYRADFAITDAKAEFYAFVEFENAEKSSIFQVKKNKKTDTYFWAARFEHGYSQVVDWYLHLARNNDTKNMKSEFGSQEIEYYGALIIGRDYNLDAGDNRDRFLWRVKNSLIDSHPVYCNTFDGLLDDMETEFMTTKMPSTRP